MAINIYYIPHIIYMLHMICGIDRPYTVSHFLPLVGASSLMPYFRIQIKSTVLLIGIC